MTSLRSGPLPRMAGDLTFMRSTRGCVEDLTSNSLAIVGIPMEENTGADVGCRMTPQALRETSVYFGWHLLHSNIVITSFRAPVAYFSEAKFVTQHTP